MTATSFDATSTTAQDPHPEPAHHLVHGREVLTGTADTIAEKLDAYREVEGPEGLMVCLDNRGASRPLRRAGPPQLGVAAAA